MSEADYKKTESAEKGASARKTELEGSLKRNNRLVPGLRNDEITAKSELEKLRDFTDEDSLQSKEARLEELQNSFNALPENDPSRESLQVEIDGLEEDIETTEATIASLERIVEDSKQAASDLATREPGIKQQIAEVETKKSELASEINERRIIRDQDIEALDQAAQEVLTKEPRDQTKRRKLQVFVRAFRNHSRRTCYQRDHPRD